MAQPLTAKRLAARAVAFALRWNSGFTCIAPRRLFVAPEIRERFVVRLREALGAAQEHPTDTAKLLPILREALDAGATIAVGDEPQADGRMIPLVLDEVPIGASILDSDIAAPIASIVALDDWSRAVDLAAHCDFALGATAFGSVPESWIERLGVGVAVYEDILVPTADPRLPFGGSGRADTASPAAPRACSN